MAVRCCRTAVEQTEPAPEMEERGQHTPLKA